MSQITELIEDIRDLGNTLGRLGGILNLSDGTEIDGDLVTVMLDKDMSDEEKLNYVMSKKYCSDVTSN